ncbi:conserved membrane hypothetical protein [Desulfosarcina cetonica]|nr:conserved membrane hypothetical protein [Desulfosarcina cetonica]
MAAALTVIPVSLIPEPWYRPLNQLTASLAGNLIRLMGTDPVVRSTHISLGDFSVNVISECSAVHLIALYAAFIYAFPTGRPQKWVGFGAGVAMILSVNIIRVAAVTMIGRYSLKLFEVSHIYLGQLGMLATVVFICLFWCRWASDPDAFDGPAGYFLRFLLFSCLPFLLWLPLNRAYQKVIDGFVEKLFSAASYTLTIPRTHSFYYQTFSFITLVGLLFAVKKAKLSTRLCWLFYGFSMATLFQIIFRICNVWISAFRIQWATIVSQAVYVLCVHALPLIIGLLFLMKVRAERGASE